MNIIFNNIINKKYKFDLTKPLFIVGLGQSNMWDGASQSFILSNYSSYQYDIQQYVWAYQYDGTTEHNRTKIPLNEFSRLSNGNNVNGDGTFANKFNAVCITAISLQKTFNVPVYFLHFAEGGTSLTEGDGDWNINDSGGLFDISVTRINDALDILDTLLGANGYTFIGFLWMQGEGGPNTTELYESAEFDLINAYKKQFDRDLLWLSGGLTETIGESMNSYYPNVNQAKINNSKKNKNIIYVNNDNLEKADQFHYTEQGYWDLGQNFVNSLILYLNNNA